MAEGGTMHVFAITLMLGLAVAALARIAERFLVREPAFRAGLLLV